MSDVAPQLPSYAATDLPVSRFDWKWIVIGLCVAFTVYIAVIPLGFLLWQSLRTPQTADVPAVFTFENYLAAYGSAETLRLFTTSLRFACGASIFAFVVGTALAPSGVTATAGGTGNLSVGIGTAGTENGARTLYWIVRCESSNGGAARGVEQANPTLLTVTGLTVGKS